MTDGKVAGVKDDSSMELDINEVIAELSAEGRLHFENAQLRVMNRKLQKALAEAGNSKNATPVRAAA